MIVYTDNAVEVRTGTPAPAQVSAGASAIVYDGGKSVEVRNASPVPTLHKYAFNGLCFRDWHPSSRYVRYGKFRNLVAATEAVEFHWLAIPVTGARRELPHGEYRFYLDDVLAATLTVSSAVTIGSFTVATAPLSHGGKLGRLHGPMGEGMPFWFHVGAAQPSETVPVQSISHDVVHSQEPYAWALVPKVFAPTPRPLAPRECPALEPGVTPPAELYLTNLVPHRSGGIYRPGVRQGIWTTANKQAYHHSDLTDKIPSLSLLDGPRGVGNLMMPTHIMSDRHGGAYCTDPWRVVRVSTSGEIKTRCGAVMTAPGGQYEVPTTLVSAYSKAVKDAQYETAADILEEIHADLRIVLRGDWSAVPRFYRGFHELWGAAFVRSRLVLDPNAPPQGGEQPHLHDPLLYVASFRNNALYRLTFDKNSFTAEPRVTLVDVIGGPFDVAEANDVLYVTETNAHRISTYDALTGQRTGELPFVAPNTEGIYIRGDWLYFSERTDSRSGDGFIKRWSMTSGEIGTVCPVPLDNNSYFIKFAVFPNGAVAYVTWSSAKFGFPVVVLPNGQQWKYHLGGQLMGGRGGKWLSRGYPSAVGVDGSRMFFGHAHEGLCMVSKALPTDPVLDEARYKLGRDEYEGKGYRVLYGDQGFGYQGFPLPFGESQNMDYYLAECAR